MPLRAPTPDYDLAVHLACLVDAVADVVVVDSSDTDVFDAHTSLLGPAGVRHLRPVQRTPMGKVGNVLTGLDAARHDIVVIADDDVRWTPGLLARALDGLGTDDLLRPQNVFEPTPWHARWDTGRVLLNRAMGGDWPGTVVVRRSALPHGYRGDVLFENLEMERTVAAGGGRCRVALDLVVPRRPSTAGRFFEQRVRQAYDEWARPRRLVFQLALLPALVRWRRRALVTGVLGSIALAERGRRRAGGRRIWGPTAPLWAPLWVGERAVTSWLAVGARLRGGVPYRDGRLRTAASSPRSLARATAVRT